MISHLKLFKEHVFFVIILVWLILPFFAYSAIARILAAISVMIVTFRYFHKIDKKLFWAIVFFIIYTGVINAYVSDGSYLLRHLQLYILLVTIYIASALFTMTKLSKLFLTKVILIFNLIAIVGTYLGLLVNSSAARILAKSSEAAIDLSDSGVGGYGTVYSNVILFPVLLLLIKASSDRTIRILSWISLISSLLMILKANYFIAILLILFQLFYLNFYKLHKALRVIGVLGILLFLISFKMSVNYIVESVYPLVEGSSLQYKFDDILNQVNGAETDYDTISGRTDRYARSIELFFSNPITGVLSFNNVGKHAIILDMFAQFGLVIGILLLFVLRRIPNKLIKFYLYHKIKVSCFLMVLIVLGLINNYALSMGAVFLLIALIDFENFSDSNEARAKRFAIE